LHKLGLMLNEAKTSVKNAQSFDFLGYTFGPKCNRRDFGTGPPVPRRQGARVQAYKAVDQHVYDRVRHSRSTPTNPTRSRFSRFRTNGQAPLLRPLPRSAT
jgi:hypothetical protein